MPFIQTTKSNTGIDLQTVQQMSSRFDNEIARTLGQSSGIKLPLFGVLGNAAGGTNEALYVPDSNNTRAYFNDGGDEPSLTGTIPVAGIPKEILRIGQRIRIRKLPNGAYEYDGLDTQLAEVFNEGGEGLPDQSPITQAQLSWVTLQPYSGMVAVVKGGIYGDSAVLDLTTADFSTSPLDTLGSPINIPTTPNRAIGVLVQLDAAISTLSYKQSAEFPASLSLPQAYTLGYLPLRDTGLWREGYIKLSNGITELDLASVWTCREDFPEKESGAPANATYITQTPDGTLSNEQALSLLATGFMKSTTTTGVISTQAQIALGADVSGTLPIANGGTGQTTQTTAMDALSPTTTKGDILVDNGSNVIRLGVGSNGARLRANSAQTSGLEWVALFTQHLIGSYSPAANINTGSTSFVDIDATNITQSVTIAAGDTIIARFIFATIQQITSGIGRYKLVAGSTDPDTLIEAAYSNTGIGGAILLTGKWTGLSAGTYAIKPQFRTSAGNARVTQNTPVSWEVMVF